MQNVMYKVSTVWSSIWCETLLPELSICLILACKVITLWNNVKQFSLSMYFLDFSCQWPPPVSRRSPSTELTVYCFRVFQAKSTFPLVQFGEWIPIKAVDKNSLQHTSSLSSSELSSSGVSSKGLSLWKSKDPNE